MFKEIGNAIENDREIRTENVETNYVIAILVTEAERTNVVMPNDNDLEEKTMTIHVKASGNLDDKRCY